MAYALTLGHAQGLLLSAERGNPVGEGSCSAQLNPEPIPNAKTYQDMHNLWGKHQGFLDPNIKRGLLHAIGFEAM